MTKVGGDRAIGLVLLAAHVFVEPECEPAFLEIRRAYREEDLRERLERRHGSNVDCAFWGWADAWGDPAFRSWNRESYLPRIDVPTLVVQGREDAYGTLAQVDAITRGIAGPARSLVMEDCGHSAYRDQPERLLAVLCLKNAVTRRWHQRRDDEPTIPDAEKAAVRDTLLAALDESLIEDVKHLEERGLVGDLIDDVRVEAPAVFGAGLAPDLQGEVLQGAAHL